MAGISLVGLSGSMIKDAVKEAPGLLVRALTLPLNSSSMDEEVETPEATMVVVGVMFTLFAQILCVFSLSFRSTQAYMTKIQFYSYSARLASSSSKKRS